MKTNLALSLIASVSLFATSLSAVQPQPNEKLAATQHLVFNAGAAPQSLDPAKIEGVPEGHFARNLFETLVISDENDKIIPGVAEKWEHSDDYKTWTFHLRKDAKFSNGDALTANDFVFAWQRLADPKTASPYASYLSYLKLKNAKEILDGKAKPESLGVVAKDDYTLVLNLEESVPFADLLTQFYVLSPVPSNLVKKLGDSWSNPENIAGNGAFKLDSFVLNEEAKLSKNPHYYDAKNVLLEQVTMLQIQNNSVAYTRYRSNDLDIATFPLELFDDVKKTYGNELDTGEQLCIYYYSFNTAKAPFNNEKTRQALSMALDRNIITDTILKQGQKPAYTFAPPSINAANLVQNPQWSKLSQDERNAQAIKLLEEAGYSKNKPLNFTLLYNTNEDHKKIAIAASAIWKKNLQGMVNVKLQNQEWKTFLSTRRTGAYEMSRAGWCSDYNEASSFLNILTSTSSNNSTGWANAEYDALIASAYGAKTEQERAEIYAKAEELVYNNAPIMPAYFQVRSELVKPYVKGFKVKPSNSYYFKDVYILEK